MQRRAEQYRHLAAVVLQKVFFKRRAGAKSHQLLERFFVETVVLGRSEVVNAARQVFGSVAEQFQETVVGVQDVSREIGEQDGHEVCVDETSQGCFDFALQVFDRPTLCLLFSGFIS